MGLYEIMEKNGWYREVHTILGKKYPRWHKDGFEIPEEEIYKIIENIF